MKYAYKLTLAFVILLTIVLSAGGYWLIYSDFTESLNKAQEQNIQTHLRDKYSLETARLQFQTQENEQEGFYLYKYGTDLSAYLGETDASFAIFSAQTHTNAVALFSNIPVAVGVTQQLDIIADGEENIRILNTKKGAYMLMASRVGGTKQLYLVSCFNINALFLQRDAQLMRFIQLEVVSLVGAAILAYILALLLTSPIKKLEAASKSIAAGAYNQLSNIRSNDEIGALSQSFDTMANAINDKITQLNLALTQRDDFVAAFTHEIKTPMTAILGYSDFLRSGKSNEEEMRLAADYIYSESKRLEALSQKLLSLMQLSDNDKIQLAPTAFCAATKAAINSLTPSARAKINFIESTELIFADADLLTDLLRNLLINADKATDENGKITITHIIEEKSVTVLVQDNGCGISAEDLPHITQPFYMGDKSRARKQNGSGMGLALAQKIAAMHNSRLCFESKQGKGTVVSLTLATVQEDAK